MAIVNAIRRSSSRIERIWNFLSKEYKLERIRVQVAQERVSLLRLSARELRDIGITREQALQEARRSYYDVPEDRTDV